MIGTTYRTEQFGLLYAGLYSPAGRDVEGVLEPLDLRFEGIFLHQLLRPELALLGDYENELAPLAYVWLLPSAVDPLPERTLARVVAAIDAGCVVALRAGDMPAIEAARRAVLPLVGGGRA